MEQVTSERQLVAIAHELGACEVEGLSPAEAALTDGLPKISRTLVHEVRARIRSGRDPLGELFLSLRSARTRRPLGATYTPLAIVHAMLEWSAGERGFSRVVDPGVGSGRFLVAAGRRFPGAKLTGIELDPLVALMARAHLRVAGFSKRAQVLLSDYRDWLGEKESGRTLFVGNPPYVRHHLIGQKWKSWLTCTAENRNLVASQLSGLHVHFFLATLERAKPGDVGTFITASEWLDVNYGALVRQMFLDGLGGKSITIVEPTARPFPDAASTAAITCFEVGSKPPSIRLSRAAKIERLGSALAGGRMVRRERLKAASRWTPLTRAPKKLPQDYVELGELCRVHRGQVTGRNKVWIAGTHSEGLPHSVLFASVTKARELFGANGVLREAARLRNVIDIPAELDVLCHGDRNAVEAFLKVAKRMGASEGYVAKNRRAWWAVGLRESAPILATYMARRPPAFVRNLAGARHINIAHGLYPRESIHSQTLDALVAYLAKTVAITGGRTYAGGLTKFEPREMERIPVPTLSLLNSRTSTVT